MISKVDFIGVPSQDSERARRFYVETLGLRPDEHAQFEFIGEIMDTGVCHMAFLTDPDGNDLMLHSRYAPQPG